jgi:hypothetical protein
MTNENRLKLEMQILRKTVKVLLEAGFSLTVFDGEEDTVKQSTSFKEIVAALRTTDEDWLYTYRNGQKTSFIYLVYGNDPWEVICDYGVSLDDILKPVFEYGEKIEEKHA